MTDSAIYTLTKMYTITSCSWMQLNRGVVNIINGCIQSIKLRCQNHWKIVTVNDLFSSQSYYCPSSLFSDVLIDFQINGFFAFCNILSPGIQMGNSSHKLSYHIVFDHFLYVALFWQFFLNEICWLTAMKILGGLTFLA